MKELIDFLKDIFMIGGSKNETKIGLSQFKQEPVRKVVKKVEKVQREVKLSDLMRRSA